MPDDTRAAPTVTDPTLLRQARAGADWQCAYCGSHQTRIDARCANCGAAQSEGARVPRGGASVAQGAPMPAAMPHTVGTSSPRGKARGRWLALALVPVVGAAMCCATAVFVARRDPPPLVKPTSVAALVGEQRWRHEVHIERYQIVSEEGFVETRPADALDVRSLGQRHHHDEQVLDHYETQAYEEQVPYQDTETYQEQEQCGQDCTTMPQSCSESCSPDDNGFATCTTTCTGGGQSCTPRYCSVTRTRQVTRYRAEQRTRQAPIYRAEPRYAEYFAWRTWRWRPARVVRESGGASEVPRWPADDALLPPAPLNEGEQERSTREAHYELDLLTRTGRHIYVARDLADYERVAAHRRWYVREEMGFALVKPVPEIAQR